MPECFRKEERVSTGGVKPLELHRDTGYGNITLFFFFLPLPLFEILYRIPVFFYRLLPTCLSEVLIVAESSRTMAIVD